MGVSKKRAEFPGPYAHSVCQAELPAGSGYRYSLLGAPDLTALQPDLNAGFDSGTIDAGHTNAEFLIFNG